MYRRGPSKATPANVQCQKCLKRGHYSYECKASAQERPYVPRPSRTQQLTNPKLVPRLSEAVPDALQKKQGVADEQLAKREAERARKRELDRDGDVEFDMDDGPSKRKRSASYDSVSTISTQASGRSVRGRSATRSRSASPPRRAGTSTNAQPYHNSHSPAPRRRSYDSASDYSRSRSATPPRRPRGRRDRPDSPVRSRYDTRENSPEHESSYRRRRRYSSSASRSPPQGGRRKFRSRSPDHFERRRGRSPPRHRDEGSSNQGARVAPPPPPPARSNRERSLSPFSKRLALTKAMNS